MSKYYGKKYMIFLPSVVYYGMYLTDSVARESNRVLSCFCASDSTWFKFYRLPGSDFLVMPVEDTITEEFGKGAYARFVTTEPLQVPNLDVRQKVTKILYGREPAGITEEVVLCFSIRTGHGSYLYLKAPGSLPLISIKAIMIHKSKESEFPDYDLELCNDTKPE
jgi:hypothetical protein